MLSLGKLSLGQEAYYLSEVLDGAEDYYLNAGEAPGRWTGRGAEALGLGGSVSAEELRAVLSGRRPDGAPRRATTASLPGIDMTLKAPKSVSLVWGLGDGATAAAVVAAHETAVDGALGYLEAQACHVRRGHGGVDVIGANGFVAAAFRHRTSRAGDPALHTHVLVANTAKGADGRWTALDTRDLYTHGRTAGFVYQTVLRHELAQTLGLLFEEMERGYADVAGVPKELRRAFSTRRGQILAAMEAHGATSAKAAAAAALATRAAKTEHVTETDLRTTWAEQAEPFGWSVTELARLPRDPALVIDDAELAARVTESQASFERRDLIRAIAQAATQGASLADIEARAEDFLAGAFAVSLTPTRWTTPEILELEQATVTAAAAGRAAGVGLVSPEQVAAALGARPSLGEDQARAVERSGTMTSSASRTCWANSLPSSDQSAISTAAEAARTMLDVVRPLLGPGPRRDSRLRAA